MSAFSDRVFKWVGVIVVLAATVIGIFYLLMRYAVPTPKPLTLGYYEIDGLRADRLVQVFASPNFDAAKTPVPDNWSPTDWDAHLGHNLTFIDAAHLRWNVPKGEINDGATVPKILWSFCPGGHNGKFLAAAIVHDRFCRVEEARRELKVEWADVHRMFYYAMRASDMPESDAKVMFAAVFCFGPPRPFEVLVQALSSRYPERTEEAKSVSPKWSGWGAVEMKDEKSQLAAIATEASKRSDRSKILVEKQFAVAESRTLPNLGPVSGSALKLRKMAGLASLASKQQWADCLNVDYLDEQAKLTKLNQSAEKLNAQLRAKEEQQALFDNTARQFLKTVESNAASLSIEEIEEMARKQPPLATPPPSR